MILNWWVLGIQTAACLTSFFLIAWIFSSLGWPVTYWTIIPVLLSMWWGSITHMNR